MTPMKKTAGLVAYGLFFTGLCLVMLSALGDVVWHWPPWATAFVRDTGLLLSAVMAGTILNEMLLREEMLKVLVDQLDAKLEARIPKLDDVASQTANAAHKLFSQHPPGMTGIRFLHDVRRNYAGYYTWVNEENPQELFFAGRSVLHRIDADIRSKTGGSAEDVLFRRLQAGSKISIAFLDPRTNFLERLAKEEGQPLETMLGDIGTSIGICQRLFDLLRDNFRTIRTGAELTIRVYDRVPYFAYHKQDEHVIVGFYFLSMKGSSSAAYELVDPVTKQVFGEHFVRILAEAVSSALVEFDRARGRPYFNDALFKELHDYLSVRLGQNKVDELMSGK